MKCPFCGEEADVPMVDIGVGEVQFGPANCYTCYAYELGPDDSRNNDEEKRTGWRRHVGLRTK